jgi:hypothetical protein
VRFWGLASRDLDEVIEFYGPPEEAALALRDALADEPTWRHELYVRALELPGPTAPSALSLN